MSETNGEHERVERLLRQAHVPEPSELRKDRVTAAARDAWKQSPVDIPWRVPLRRLALSAAAAVFIITLTNHISRFGAPPARSDRHPIETAAMHDRETLPEATYSPLMNRLVRTDRRPTPVRAPALRRYMEDIQKILNELEGSGTGVRPAPNGGGSHLPPKRPGWGAYS